MRPQSFEKYPQLLKIIEAVKERLIDSETMREAFEEYNIPLEDLNYIPICFAEDMEVSARTEKGVIYINCNLLKDEDLDDIEKCNDVIDHYLAHEVEHWLQQTTGTGPTEGSASDEDYLDNKYEQKGFQNQTQYLTETRGPEEAEKYIDHVLDHHHVPKKEREEKKDELLVTASVINNEEIENLLDNETIQEIELYANNIGVDCFNAELDVIDANEINDIKYWLKNKEHFEGKAWDEEFIRQIGEDGKINRPIIIDVDTDYTVEGRHRLTAALKYNLSIPIVILTRCNDEENLISEASLKEDLMEQYDQEIERGPKDVYYRKDKWKLTPEDRREILDRLKAIKIWGPEEKHFERGAE